MRRNQILADKSIGFGLQEHRFWGAKP